MICEKCKIDSKHYANVKRALDDAIKALDEGLQHQDKDGDRNQHTVFTQQFGISFLEYLKKAQEK